MKNDFAFVVSFHSILSLLSIFFDFHFSPCLCSKVAISVCSEDSVVSDGKILLL